MLRVPWPFGKMERIHWLVFLCPPLILILLLFIFGLGRKKLCKRPRDSKDEEGARILIDGTKPPMYTNVPPNQHKSEGKSHTGSISEPDGPKRLTPNYRNQDSQSTSSMGTGVHPRSATSSDITGNRKAAIQIDSVKSGRGEEEKRGSSKFLTQEQPSNVSGTSGQRNETQSHRNSDKSSRSSQSSSGNGRQRAQSDHPPEMKPKATVDEQDSNRMTSRPSEGQSSSYDKTRREKQKQAVLESKVSDAPTMEIDPQQSDTTEVYRRQSSKGDSDERPPRGIAEQDNTTRQSDLSSSRVPDSYRVKHEDHPPEMKPKATVDEEDSNRMALRRSGGQSSNYGIAEEDNTTRQSDLSSSRVPDSYRVEYEDQPLPKRSKRDLEDKHREGSPLPEPFNTDKPDQLHFNKSFNDETSQATENKKRHEGNSEEIPKSSVQLTEVENDDTSRQLEPTDGRRSPIDKEMDVDSYIDLIKKMFVQKLMGLDVTARNICSMDGDMSSDNLYDSNSMESEDCMDTQTCNPLDIMCVVLQDSDSFLQQEIVTKMSMCQFALPLLLPAGDRSHYIFMLWAMRDIVKKWKPQSLAHSTSFVENNLVKVQMPIFSFVRLGQCNLSKSKLLNQVLSPPEFINNYFVYGDMPGGNGQRNHSDGLVEMSCFFPAGRGHLDIFPDPVAVTNLRGDLECHLKQFDLLSRVSSAVFVFIESINETHRSLLSDLVSEIPQIFLIVNLGDERNDAEVMEFLRSLSTKHNLKKDKFIVKTRKVNDTQVVKALQSKIKVLLANTVEKHTLKKIADKAAELNFKVDENFQECKEAKKVAMEITNEIKNILDYKRNTMKLQGDLWKQLAKKEKELCRMRKLEDRDVEEYKSQLQGEIAELRKQQSEQDLADGVRKFQDSLIKFSSTERKVFLKWLKIRLDKLGRHQLAKLNDEYRELMTDVASNAHDLMEIDQKIVDSSLGVEHFIRELGQFYEVQRSIRIQEMSTLPKTAADLLLDGFPLELIDGDASNIPLQWISEVLSELERKKERKLTVRVITVLGVQSTGKSTLLNTMFGLHLPTSSGRCTRGAFMTLLDTKKDFQEDLGCDFVMVIDTEGLKSMELASLEGSYEHDNELATVAVGLSDITIVNMAMENTEEMKDILQIVIHAFLRMKEVGKKSSCQFVHQNVSDVSAHVKNRRAREKFIEQLNEMTKVSARMEKKGGVTGFSDIIHCDIEKNSWYIPGLWHGIPPMASISYGYSETVQELKKSIAEYLKSMPGKPQDITEFKEWMTSLWNAVKHEKFVFSFRNRLVTEAYNQLCIQYSDWEWRFQKKSHDWMIKTETLIFNLSSNQLGTETWGNIEKEINCLLDKEELVMARSLEKYFTDDCDNAHLLEMFKGDFFRSIKYLRKNLEIVLLGKCDQTIQLQKEKCHIQAVQERYISILEEKVSEIMDKRGKNQNLVNAEQLKREFETIWEKATSTLPPPKLKRRNIDLEILQQLKREMRRDDSNVFQELDHLTSLNQFKVKSFQMNLKYLQVNSDQQRVYAEGLAASVLEKCNEKITEIANSKKDFNEIYSLELLKMINKDLNRHKGENLQTKELFELDLKLCVLGEAAMMFQRMHEDFIQANDPRSYLEEMKPQYFSIFNNMLEKRNECQRRAEQFCTVCLKPAVMEHINRCLGTEIVDDILEKNGPQEFKSRKILQREVLKTLLSVGNFEQYEEYVNSYESFMKRWISRYLTKHYEGQDTVHTLQVYILQGLMVKIKQALYDGKALQAKTISGFLAEFCNVLKEELVISQNSSKVITFQSNLSTVKQFAHDIELYLSDLEKQVEHDLNSLNIETTFSQLTLKPQDELFRKVMGCGKQCPFCKAPCEAGGEDHQEHFASVHRPRGLAQHVNEETKALDHTICSSNVISNKSFRNADTEGKPHPYKEYRKYYPDWAIYPDTAVDGSDYWRFVLKEFNGSLANLYNAKPANLPEDWKKLTKKQALKSLKKHYS